MAKKKKGGRQKPRRKGEAAVAKATGRLGRQEARLAVGQASCRPEGRRGHLSPMACMDAPRRGRGGGREEFPSPLEKSWLPAMTRGGLGRQARASNPNLAEERKVELRAGMQLFAALPGMQEQSRVAGIGAGSAGGTALSGRSLTLLLWP